MGLCATPQRTITEFAIWRVGDLASSIRPLAHSPNHQLFVRSASVALCAAALCAQPFRGTENKILVTADPHEPTAGVQIGRRFPVSFTAKSRRSPRTSARPASY